MGDDARNGAVAGLPGLPGFLPDPSAAGRDDLIRLAAARPGGVPALAAFERSLGDLAAVDDAVAVALLLSYRAERAWDHFFGVVAALRPGLAQHPYLRQQHGFALNRAGRGDDAEALLLALKEEAGPSPETNGILGRVYKDRFMAAHEAGDEAAAAEWRQRAVGVYLEGHDADPTDPYPGINALALMEFDHPKPPRHAGLLDEVTTALRRRLDGAPRYWDHATEWELALLAHDEAAAAAAMDRAMLTVEERWQAASTQFNTRMVQAAWATLGLPSPAWVDEMASRLGNAARGIPPPRPRGRFRLRPPRGPAQWLVTGAVVAGGAIAGAALVGALTNGDSPATTLGAGDVGALAERCAEAVVEVFGEDLPTRPVAVPFRERGVVGEVDNFCMTAAAGDTLRITVTFDTDPGAGVSFDVTSPQEDFVIRFVDEGGPATGAVFELVATIGADDVYLMEVTATQPVPGGYTLEVSR